MSTGIGMGAMVNNVFLTGHSGFAGELFERVPVLILWIVLAGWSIGRARLAGPAAEPSRSGADDDTGAFDVLDYQISIAATPSRLWIDGVAVVNNDGLHGTQEIASAPIALAAGMHDLRMVFFEAGGGASATLSYLPPGGAKQVIPASVLFPAKGLPRSRSFRRYLPSRSCLPQRRASRGSARSRS
jgi:hypothetical protein